VILVDTSIWVSHLRGGSGGNERLINLLNAGGALCHPFIIGELACGRLSRREEILSLLQTLPQTPVIEPDELLHFIDRRKLAGEGACLIDVHLLASAVASGNRLWTDDKKINRIASRLGVAA
jgi:predicted nucleic acid-binding protein